LKLTIIDADAAGKMEREVNVECRPAAFASVEKYLQVRSPSSKGPL
jgi:hypothetical protein